MNSNDNFISIAIVYHSGYGHTKNVAEAVAEGVNETGFAKAILITAEDADNHWDDLEKAHGIIFGSPTYMGSVSAKMKEFMEKSSKYWMEQKWKDKIAAGFTNSGSQSGDKLSTLFSFAILAAQHGMIWVGTGLLPGNNNSKGSRDDLNRIGSTLGVMTQSNIDEGPDVAPIKSDLLTAKHLGKRTAEAAKRWNAA